MYVDNFDDGHVEVEYIPAHTGHDLSHNELRHLPLPLNTKEEVVTKLSLGVNTSRILNGKKLCIQFNILLLMVYQSTSRMYE